MRLRQLAAAQRRRVRETLVAKPTHPIELVLTLAYCKGGAAVADVDRLSATRSLAMPAAGRNRAILFLLARLGLRVRDVRALRLHNVDWQHATLTFRGKGRRETRLPLPQDAGDAVLDYLKRNRSSVTQQELLLTSNATFARCPARASQAYSTCGRQQWHHGLRNSAATSMLRGGATLGIVGAVPGHRSTDTTAHYAKGDIVIPSRDLSRYVDQ